MNPSDCQYQKLTLLALFFAHSQIAMAGDNAYTQTPMPNELDSKAFPQCTLTPNGPYLPDDPLRTVFGAWNSVFPAKEGAAIRNILGMQTVHTAMLPSGKILLVSGSSWRNSSEQKNPPIQYYPEVENPETPKGLFVKSEDPFDKTKIDSYFQAVNNVAIYDPEKNTFYRIPHPYPENEPDPLYGTLPQFAPNDLFCTGQMHLPNGNVLFAGGTQYYTPYRTGNRSTYQFDWRKELEINWRGVDWRKPLPPAGTGNANPWKFSGFMKTGRWYPTLVPLLDGRMAIFSGFTGFDKVTPDMYQFQINNYVEFFDPAAFNESKPQDAWKAVDVKKLPNSPFTVKINDNFKPSPETRCNEQCKEDNKFDAFKLYPHNYLVADGKIYMTQEGDWVSLRTCDTAYMRKTKHTYWANIGGNAEKPEISFAPGPDRPQDVSSYGTSFVDPTTSEIRIVGGQPTSQGSMYPLNSSKPTHFAGGRGSRKLETFNWSAHNPKGFWKLDPDFIGEHPQDDRTMHYALILPTKQILLVNGANYDFYGPVLYPLLLTPKFSSPNKFIGYDKKRMAEAMEPRLYHNAAMLLPDGRVFVSGGNSVRATYSPPASNSAAAGNANGQPKPDLSNVALDVYFVNDGPVGKAQKGMQTTPAENWTAEIYSPPYMFIDEGRQVQISSLRAKGARSYRWQTNIGGKEFNLLHSGKTYEAILESLPLAPSCRTADGSLSLIKLASSTHGWDGGQKFVKLKFSVKGKGHVIKFTTPDAKQANIPPAYYMMFYVDCRGKPSMARMVRFDDDAPAP